MNSGILPLLLLGVTVSLALSSVPEGLAWRSWVAAVIVALAVSLAPIGGQWLLTFEIALWVSVVLTAALSYLPARIGGLLLLPLAVNDGAWLGAVAAASSSRAVMTGSLLIALTFLPVKALTSRGSAVAVKVVASWMIAIGSLAIFVSMVPTPGYKQDHME